MVFEMLSANSYKSLLRCLLIPALLWLFFNATTNWHYHQLPTGEIARHSHPYQNEGQDDQGGFPFQNHEHSSQEYLNLDHTSKVSGLEASCCQAPAFTATEQQPMIIAPTSLRLAPQPLPKNILRGPPARS